MGSNTYTIHRGGKGGGEGIVFWWFSLSPISLQPSMSLLSPLSLPLSPPPPAAHDGEGGVGRVGEKRSIGSRGGKFVGR